MNLGSGLLGWGWRYCLLAQVNMNVGLGVERLSLIVKQHEPSKWFVLMWLEKKSLIVDAKARPWSGKAKN
jgi:hypothetical protein